MLNNHQNSFMLCDHENSFLTTSSCFVLSNQTSFMLCDHQNSFLTTSSCANMLNVEAREFPTRAALAWFGKEFGGEVCECFARDARRIHVPVRLPLILALTELRSCFLKCCTGMYAMYQMCKLNVYHSQGSHAEMLSLVLTLGPWGISPLPMKL